MARNPLTSGCATELAIKAGEGVNHSECRVRKWYEVMLSVAKETEESPPIPKMRLSWAVREKELAFEVERVVVYPVKVVG